MKKNRRSSDGERVSTCQPSRQLRLHLVPADQSDRRDIIRSKADPTLQREAETAGEPTAGEALVMPPH